MSDVVRTWDANFAGEIALTDAELEAVYGAGWGDWDDDGGNQTPAIVPHGTNSFTATGTFGLITAGTFTITHTRSF